MSDTIIHQHQPPRGQLLKWIGNKQRSAAEIASVFPDEYGRYFEPFLGAGAVMATVAPHDGLGSDTYGPLIEIWDALANTPEELVRWYAERWYYFMSGDKTSRYTAIRERFNSSPNGADLLFLCRSCYGGVVRFRKADGHMSTPIGAHNPISPESFRTRVEEWHVRMKGCRFAHADYTEAFALAEPGDLIYCDPPYAHSQSILYGAQGFSLDALLREIMTAKNRGVLVVLSIDGHKQSGRHLLELTLPDGLFETQLLVDKGPSMLRRFQLNGTSSHGEGVADRLLLTYPVARASELLVNLARG
ncbi:MAG: Dam family site-specific DNA-(adenine-N6)-methyltransferase [Actinomycetia bacterium]|nr:Dam family site-specific DNA-(adenine-N6)-methyltransferase [Actinomycetes bacterium]